MSLIIDQLELGPKDYARPERRPTLILLEASEPEMTPHLASVSKKECEALFFRLWSAVDCHPMLN
jgi:hypothetical protein